MTENVVMNQSEYLENRLQNQIKWYSNKSGKSQRNYKRLQTTEIVIASLIPVIITVSSLYDNYGNMFKVLVGLLGATITIIEATCKMNKYHENWIQYRYIAELLKHEKYLFQTRTAPYDETEEEAFSLLVQRVERTISSENVNWVGINEDRKN